MTLRKVNVMTLSRRATDSSLPRRSIELGTWPPTDPMFPIEHGLALAAEIPGARLASLPGAGHQQPPRELWDLAIAAIVEHTEHGHPSKRGNEP
jgi:hypothetical protein